MNSSSTAFASRSGGIGALFGNGQPGLTVNFVQKEGGRDFEGLVKASITDYGDLRGDMLLSGTLGENTSFMVGGYYPRGEGFRSPGFTAVQGGQNTSTERRRVGQRYVRTCRYRWV